MFEFHKLNSAGIAKSIQIQKAFENILKELEVICIDTREFSIAKTKLEEACFFAKRSMAIQKENQL